MNGGINIPVPVLFNPFKHHRNYIVYALRSLTSESVVNLLESVCNNYSDIYTGTMAPESIGEEVIEILRSKQVFQENDFTRWVSSQRGYRQIKLKDQSEWIVRKSDDPERYVHVHPARTGPFSVRFKGSTLKTIYMLQAESDGFQGLPSLKEVNRVRIKVALSPIKNLDREKGILRCYEKFFDKA
ncbi:MAG: hypothetical protein AB2L24_01505 [Mangrovibacterium sp.]